MTGSQTSAATPPLRAAGKPPSDLRRVITLVRRFAASHKRWFLLGIGFLAFEALTAVFESYPIAYVIDFLNGDRAGLLSTRMGTVALVGALIIGIASINSLADSLAEVALARAGRSLGFDLRFGLYQHLTRLSMDFHDRRRTGDTLTRVTGDVNEVEDFVIGSFSDLVGSIFVLVGTISFLATNSWQVTAVAVVTVPVLAWVSTRFTGRIKSASKRHRARQGDVASDAQEMLSSIRVIQTFGRNRRLEQRFADNNGKVLKAAMEQAKLEAGFSWSISVLQAVSTVIVIWVGVFLIDRGSISTGTLLMFILLVKNMFKPTRRIIKEWNSIAKVFASVERISDLLDRTPDVVDAPDAQTLGTVKGRIELRDVTFGYAAAEDDGRPPALQGLSLVIEPGEMVAIVGPSGAGKSTIAQLVPRLYDVAAGSVVIDGHDVRNVTIESLRGCISTVLQETVLFTGSVADNIAFGDPDLDLADIEVAARRANAHDFIAALPNGYATQLGERAANLSGGQRQRLSIARAFIRNTPILILDEPTTGLDPEASEAVFAALLELAKGKTTLVVTHDLNLARAADRIVVIESGCIAESGSHHELVEAGGVYARLWRPTADEPGTSKDVVDLDSSLGTVERRSSGDRTELTRATGEALLEPSGSRQEGEPSLEPQPNRVEPQSADPLASPELLRLLPTLHQAIDGGLIEQRLLSLHVAGTSVQVVSAGKLRYEASGSCAIRYEVVSTQPDGTVTTRWWTGRVFARASDATALHLRVRRLASRVVDRADLADVRVPHARWSDLRLVVTAHPIDSELPTAIAATDPPTLQRMLSPVLPGAADGVTAHLVKYARHHRCVLRYETASATAFAKVFGEGVAFTDPLVVAQLRMHAATWRDPFAIPEVLLVDRDLRMVVMEAVPGESITTDLVREAMNHGGADVCDAAQEAVMLCASIAAALHCAPIVVAPRTDWADHLDALRNELADLAPLDAALERRLGGLIDQAESRHRPASALVLGHGDFTASQVLFHDDGVALLDFDTLAMAEPGDDIGRFIAYLRLACRKKAASTGSWEDVVVDRFIVEYATATGRSPEAVADEAAAYELTALIRAALHAWRHLKGSRLTTLLAILDSRSPVTVDRHNPASQPQHSER